MLERVAMHQTQLRMPGLSVDSKGVALGAKLLILLASMERLVAFLSLYTAHNSLAPQLGGLRIEVLISEKTQTRELALSLDITSSEQMDAFVTTARVVGGHAFTGTDQHFVQVRDPSAPFGYDVVRLHTGSNADYIFYHTLFTQKYRTERQLELRNLLEKLQLHVDPSRGIEDDAQVWVLAERGVGTALIHYFVRSGVQAEVGVAQWPPESALDTEPVERYLFRVDKLPPRMRHLVIDTPGISSFILEAPGVAVQTGHRHPINLRSVPVFDSSGLVLLRGGRHEPLHLETMPSLGPVSAFSKADYVSHNSLRLLGRPTQIKPASVQPRLMPSPKPLERITASHLAPEEYALLRTIAYRLPPTVLASSRIAFTDAGAFVLQPGGVENVPLGTYLTEIKPTLYIAAGYQPVPAVNSETLFTIMGSPRDHIVFWTPRLGIVGVPLQAFAPLENAILEGQKWAPTRSFAIEANQAPGAPQLMYEHPKTKATRGGVNS